MIERTLKSIVADKESIENGGQRAIKVILLFDSLSDQDIID